MHVASGCLAKKLHRLFLRCLNSVFNPIGESLDSGINSGNFTSSASNTVRNDPNLEVVEVSIDVDWEHQWTALERNRSVSRALKF